MRAPTVVGVSLVAVSVHDSWVAAMGFLDHRGLEPTDVVRTNQPKGNLWVDRHIEQGLIQLAFENLLGATSCPDRLANSAYRTAVARVLINKLLPGWNDACGIPTELGHVDEFDLASLVAEASAQPVGVTPHDGDHDGLACRQAVLDEWRKDRRVVVSIAPHERLVSITLLRSRWGGLRHNFFLKQIGSRCR